MSACGGSTNNQPQPSLVPQNPAPVINSLSPASIAPGMAPFVLVVDGTGFIGTSVIRWNGNNKATTFNSSTQLQTTITLSELDAAGRNVPIVVVNPTPGGGTSSAVNFTVLYPLPQITSITPNYALLGSGGFTLAVTGSTFNSSSVVQWNGSNRATTFVSSSSLTATIPAADVAVVGIAAITVLNVDRGGTSNSMQLSVSSNNPLPTLTALSPVSALRGTAPVVTVDGTNFLADSVVRFNGSDVSTTYVSGTRLTALMPTSNPAVDNITVFNRAPGGGSSNALTFTILNYAPSLTSISPSSAIAGDAPMVLDLHGSNLWSDGVVLVNGQPHASKWMWYDWVQIVLSTPELASATTLGIKFREPAPGGGDSQTVNFVIAPRVANPQPTISSLADNQAPQGWPGFSLRVNGTGFVAGTQLRFNGALRTTNALSNTQVRATILPADLTTAGTINVTVENSGPGGGISAPAAFTITPVSATAIGVTQNLGVRTADFVTAASDQPSMDSTGRFVAFRSSGDLVGDGQDGGVFHRDTCITGPGGCVSSVIRISSGGASPSISADGRHVAFTNGLDLYLRDTCVGAIGCTPTTIKIAPDGNSVKLKPQLSGNGRYVAYREGDDLSCFSCSIRIKITDTCAGAASGCSIAVVSSINDVNAINPRLSATGRYLVYDSYLGQGQFAVARFDTCLGAPTGCISTTTTISAGLNGQQATGSSFTGAMSADGRYVAFNSFARNLVANDAAGGGLRAYLRDTCSGAVLPCTPATLRISDSDTGNAVDVNSTVVLSGDTYSIMATSSDGRFVAFVSSLAVVAGDTNLAADVFLRDTCIGAVGCTPGTKRISTALNGAQGIGDSDVPVISSDGKYVVFVSNATSLAPGVNDHPQVYVARTRP